MILIAFTTTDIASSNLAQSLKERHGLEEGKEISGMRLHRLDAPLLHSDHLDSLGAELIVFLSRHSSASGTPAMTVHALGNWSIEAKLGGKPKELSVAAPEAMFNVICSMAKSQMQIEKTYEATHHGPLLKTPSLFAEIGGNQHMIEDKNAAGVVADAVYEGISALSKGHHNYKKVAIGVGGTHYPEKFTRLAVENGYAFSHIMPKYSLINDTDDNIDMLEQAVTRSAQRPELAVIDWKSMNSGLRQKVTSKLEKIGIAYERI